MRSPVGATPVTEAFVRSDSETVEAGIRETPCRACRERRLGAG
jgi:hypothetical protein